MENKELIFNSNIDKLIESADLTKEAPTEEPYRQYWFMKKARELVKNTRNLPPELLQEYAWLTVWQEKRKRGEEDGDESRTKI